MVRGVIAGLVRSPPFLSIRSIVLDPDTNPTGSRESPERSTCTQTGFVPSRHWNQHTGRARPHFEFHPKYRNFLLGCEVSEMRGRRVDLWSCFFFFFQFAYHLLHLPLLTPEGLRGDFDLNRKSRVVRLRISSSLNSAGKTLAPCLDSQTGSTGGSGLQESWFDLKGVRAFVKSRSLVL